MDKLRRKTRSRVRSVVFKKESSAPKKASPIRTRASPSRRASPGRTRSSPAKKRISPVRKSSRPRSTIPTIQPASAAATSTPKEQTQLKVSHTNLPTTLTTNTSTRAPGRKTTTSSTQSTYSATTQKTVDIPATNASDINKLTDFIRRSAAKTISSVGRAGLRSRVNREESFTPSQHTEGDSQYSRSMSRSFYDGDDRYSNAEFSDSEINAVNKSTDMLKSSTCRKLAVPTEFGGWIGISLLLILIPTSVYYLHWCCAAQSCKFKMPNFNGILNANYLLQDIFNAKSVGAYLGFNCCIFVLSAFLFGRGVRLAGCAEYKFNALPMALIFLLAISVAKYFKIPIDNFILENYLRFCIYGFLNAYVVALWAYLRSDLLKQKDAALYNVYAKSGNAMVDYALGRQLNPKWLGLVDFKQMFYKASLITTFIYASCLIFKTIQFPFWPKDGKLGIDTILYVLNNIKYDKTALLCAFMLGFYVFDSIAFEHHLACSFEIQGEGFGCLLLLRYAATPYLLSAVAKYLYDNITPLNCKLAAYVSLLILIFGVLLKRFSNSLKYKYRVQPKHPYFKNVDTIHTYQGKRLLLGPIWGNLRQPNYLGDIVAIIGLGLPLAMRFAWPPLICLVLIILLLVHRCLRVDARNASRYHSSWVRYCNIARNYLVPKIF